MKRGLSPEVKRRGHEDSRSLPTSVVTNEWICTSTPLYGFTAFLLPTSVVKSEWICTSTPLYGKVDYFKVKHPEVFIQFIQSIKQSNTTIFFITHIFLRRS
jgi:hypothetical protein